VKTLAVIAGSEVGLVTLMVVVDVAVKTDDVETWRCSSCPGRLRSTCLTALTAGVEIEGGITTVVFVGATIGVYRVVVQLSIEAKVDVLV